MSDCRQTTAAILRVIRRDASEGDRLFIEQHLVSCQRCREERAQGVLLEQLRDQPTPRLGSEARARMLSHLQKVGAGVRPRRDSLRGGRIPTPRRALAVAVVAVIGVVGAGLGIGQRSWFGAKQPPGAAGVARGTRGTIDRRADADHGALVLIQAESAGEHLGLDGVRIAYQRGTSLRVPQRRDGRLVELLAGSIDVDVTPGGAGRFRVLTERFVVEVLGTRFEVTPVRVVTLHGTVQVRERRPGQARYGDRYGDGDGYGDARAGDGKVIALVRAGETWTVPGSSSGSGELGAARAPGGGPAAPPSIPAGGALPSIPGSNGVRGLTAGEPPPVATAAPSSARTSGGPTLTAAQSLNAARAALSAGDGPRARARLAAALAAHPTVRERAMASLLMADSYLIESRRDLALAAYRRTQSGFGAYPEGETAEFAAAELLFEKGQRSEAREALEQYLASRPAGRFAREAKDKLALLAAP